MRRKIRHGIVAVLALGMAPVPEAPEACISIEEIRMLGGDLYLFEEDSAAATPDPLPASDTPRRAVERLFRAYECRRLPEYADMLTADFRFVSADPEVRTAFPDGFKREDETASAEHLFHGFTTAAGVELPAAREIVVITDTMWAEPDPERPDSSSRYQQVVVPRVRMSVVRADGSALDVDDGPHVFRVVRGDAARLGAGQPEDANHWYVWMWRELLGRMAGAILAEGPARPPRVEPPVAPPRGAAADSAARDSVARDSTARAGAVHGARGPLTIRGLPSPARASIEIEFRLPGRESARLELYDVAGRRVSHRELWDLGPGDHRVTLGDRAAIMPGVYWIRLSQGRERVTAPVAVVR